MSINQDAPWGRYIGSNEDPSEESTAADLLIYFLENAAHGTLPTEEEKAHIRSIVRSIVEAARLEMVRELMARGL